MIVLFSHARIVACWPLTMRAALSLFSVKITSMCLWGNLPTTFDDEEEEEDDAPPAKSKRPLKGPRTAKNRQPTHLTDSTSEHSDVEHQEPKRPKTPQPKDKPKHQKKPVAVVSDDSDMDDDELGITPRTPPESPFYRGHRSKVSAAQVTKPAQPSSSKKTGTAQTRKTKEQPPNPKPAETNVEKQKKKKTNKKQRTALQDLAEEQDKLYAELHKVARKSK